MNQSKQVKQWNIGKGASPEPDVVGFWLLFFGNKWYWRAIFLWAFWIMTQVTGWGFK